MREEDKIVKEIEKREVAEHKNQHCEYFKHQETSSGAGVLLIFTLGILHARNKESYEKRLIRPNYPSDAVDRKLLNFKYEITDERELRGRNLEFIQEHDDPANGYVKSNIVFPAALFGNAFVNYKFSYDFSFKTIKNIKAVEYEYKHELECYKEKGKTLFVSFLSNSLKTEDKPEEPRPEYKRIFDEAKNKISKFFGNLF